MKKRMISLSLALCLALSLVIPAGAANNASSSVTQEDSTMINSLFTNKEESYIFTSDGTDITEAFLSKHQNDYNEGNFSAIIEDFEENLLLASYPATSNGISPLMNVNFGKERAITGTFLYLGKTYSYTVTVKVTGLVNDYNFHFQSLNYATKRGFSSTLSSARLSKFEPNGLFIDSYLPYIGKQFLRVGISYGGHYLENQWLITANAKDDTLKVSPAP